MSTDGDTAADQHTEVEGARPLRHHDGPYWQDGWYWPAQPADREEGMVPPTAEPPDTPTAWNGSITASWAAPALAAEPPEAPTSWNGSGTSSWAAPAPVAEPTTWSAPTEAPVAVNGSAGTNGAVDPNGSSATNGSRPSSAPVNPSFADGKVVDIRELPLASVKPRPRAIQTDAEAAEAAAVWMRWMGFTDACRASNGPDGGIDVISTGAVAQVTLHDKPALEELHRAASGRLALFFSLETFPDDVQSWGDAAGVALFRFDGHGEPEPTNSRAAELMPARQFGAQPAPVTTWCEPYQPVGPGLLHYPTMVSDVQALTTMRRSRQGLVRKETLAWLRQTWVPLYCIRTEFTTMAGLRGELRFASCQQMFDSVGGRPFNFKAPKKLPPLQMSGPAVVPVEPRVTAAEIMNQTVAIWNDYCGRDKKALLKRDSAVLTGRGVPAGVAHTINLELESEVLYPVFVGLLTHSTGHRLAVVDGVRGALHPSLTKGMTANFRVLTEQLERNRYVELVPATGYFAT